MLTIYYTTSRSKWCEDVAAYRAADGADGAGVRVLLRDTVLRTVRTVLV